MTRRLAFVVGDTAGHVLPALAVAHAYREHVRDIEIVCFAAAGGHASRIVPPTGIRLEIVPGAPLAGVGLGGKLKAAGTTVATVREARRRLTREGSRLVIGSGGFASGGVLLAARSLQLRTAIIEPNAVPGLANRLLKRITHRVYLTFPDAQTSFPANRTLLTGTPVAAALVDALWNAEPRVLGHDSLRLLVTGGSRGDAFLASAVPPLAAALRTRGLSVSVRHQTGSIPPQEVAQRYRDLGVPSEAASYLDMATAYTDADFVIARSGAGTLAEIAIAGLPSLLVPLADAAADHQSFNARAVAESGAAVWIRERDWTVEGVANLIAPLLSDVDGWRRAARAARAWARPGAAAAIVADCEKQMRGHW
jgi:UDP-N-acetylglucosamine--N-acetylmuramyl-(pentapeptide) pyrophosphoryl-undecaprenol N-acetylglucosamine transferase